MNKITLKGLLRNIKPSHTIKDIEYDKADILVTRDVGKEDLLSLKFKKYSNKYKEGDIIELTGNLRSYSQKLDNNKNKVSLYVFTYFDIPETEDVNKVELDGRICKIEPLRKTKDGKINLHFILANNLIIDESNQKLNSYIPCIAWNNLARDLSKLQVNDQIKVIGELHSREYKKELDNGEIEIRVAHECLIKSFEVI